MMAFMLLSEVCPVWPCEVIVVVVSVLLGGIVGYGLGLNVGRKR